MSLTQTLIGTLVKEPDLKFVGAQGTAVANFTIAVNERRFNKDANKWEDGDSMFLDCAAWKGLAEQIAENLTKGSRVIVVGKLKQENWEKDGQKRSRLKLDVEDIGTSIKFAQKRPDARADDPWGAPSASADW